MGGPRNKDMGDLVSRIADSLLGELGRQRGAGADGGERQKAGSRLREEISKELEREGEALGKFLGLVESFTDIIPEEDKRYSAAMKALSHASGLEPEDILKAAEGRLARLGKLEEALYSAAERWREGLGALEARSREIRGQISKLQDQVRRLEGEEKEIQGRIASGDEEVASAKETLDEVMGDLEREITGIKEKLVRYGAREAPARSKQPQGEGARRKGDMKKPSPRAAAGERTCPNCRGRMDWYEVEKTWKCFVCAYEESG